MKQLTLTLIIGLGGIGWAQPTSNVLDGGICINEFLADPNGANNFDTDGNGTADTLDEFVEIYNLSAGTIDIGGFELWDAGTGNWFTFPGGTMLGPGNYAFVIAAVQAGGSLPALPSGNLAFDAGSGGGNLNNGGDNVTLYDPGADQFIQCLYNGDAADDPTTYGGFSATATIVGTVEDFGSDTDGLSLVREPSGDINIVVHTSSTPGGNASPGFPVELESFSVE